MLELDFETFIEHYEKQNKLKNEDRRILHYLEESNKFTLYLKSVDYWEYFTVVPMSKILSFGAEYGVDKEKAITDFKMNFLYGGVPLKSKVSNVQQKKELKKEVEIVQAAESYDVFLEKKVRAWKSSILEAVDKELGEELLEKDFDVVDKSFGAFLRELLNTVNTSGFFTQLKAVIKATLKEGVEEAEKELNIDIGFDVNVDKNAANIAQRQLDGFYLGNNDNWKGIKGVSTDVQNQITDVVKKGIADRESLKEVKSNINDVFAKQLGTEETEGRLTTIARTETNRIRNASKIDAYERSGLVGKVVWDSFHDNRTSELCERMNGQEVNPGELFTDPKTGEQFHGPPAHPNCFVKNTKIRTNKGNKNIQDIKVGDVVSTHRNRYRKVIAKMENTTNEIYEISIGSGKNKTKLEITANHPVLTNNGWKTVKELSLSDYVVKIKCHGNEEYCFLKINSIKRVERECPVYNISVDEDESYIANEIVVHNCRSTVRFELE